MIALLEAHRAGLFKRGHILNNVVAGVIVGIVAIPLAMAFAIASGAKPEQGLYTAIVAGLLTTTLGGTRLQISGPTGAFIAVLSGITAQYGIAGLQVATLMAGLILLVMGIAHMGAVIKYIPDPVIVGFTSGIGVIIWIGQWKDFFGLKPGADNGHFHDKLLHLLEAFPTLDLHTTVIALLSLGILVAGAKYLERIPGLRRVPAPLIALLVATGIQAVGHYPTVATIGSAYGGIPRSLPSLQFPELSLSLVIQLVGPAFTIALLGAIESLLAAVVADGMAGTRHNSNQELVGQGIANLAAPLFGGFAATGAIARTATNIRNGATSPLAGIVHAVTLILVIVLFAPYASSIPLCALSAILFFVAWNMSDVGHFARLARTAPRADVAVLLLTFVLTVFVDLVVAVNVGVVVAALFFMRRMAQSVNVEEEVASGGGNGGTAAAEGAAAMPGVMVYRIDGPFFFGAAEKLESVLDRVQSHVNTVVLRMGRVPFVDATGLATLASIIVRFQKRHVRVVVCELQPNVERKLERAGVLATLGADNVHADLASFNATLSRD
ncbi:MAG: SulP family inorganic anion transporter [Steroidobacteraceae bacterium]